MRGSRVVAYSLLALAYLLGCASMGWFGVFLWAGPHPVVELNLRPPTALAFDALLSLAWFLQHSGMIRKSFRRKLAAVVPEHYCSAVYAVASGVALLLVPALWQPTGQGILALSGPPRWLARGLFLVAMGGMVWSFGSLRTFDPIGSGPILAHLRGVPARATPLTIRGPYRWVRHPIYALMLLMIWGCPDVTADRLLFNVLWSGWMVVATRLEERDLATEFGDDYRKYQRLVPRLVPRSLHPRI